MGNHSNNNYETSYAPDDGMKFSQKNNERTQAGVDKEIEELEAELEIARLEAKILKLRNAKGKAGKMGSTPVPPSPQYSNRTQDDGEQGTFADDVPAAVYTDTHETGTGEREVGSAIDLTI